MGQNATTPPNVMQTDPGAPPMDNKTMTPQQRQMLAMMLMQQPQQQGRVATRQGPLDAMSHAAMQYMMMGGKLPGG